MEDRLRECPFCGSEPTLVSDFKPGRNGCQTAIVRCYNCHSDGYIADSCMNETEQDAINRWNTRTPDPLLEKMAEALKEVVRCLSHGLQDTRANVTAKQALQEYRERKDAKQRRDS